MRRSSIAVLAALLLSFGGSEATSGATVERLSGTDRYATAVAISEATFTPGVPAAYIATGRNFPDALAAGPVAAKVGAPVLLVDTNLIPPVVATELVRLRPASIRVVGGPSVVSDAVLAALRAFTTGSVERLAGADRYATAEAVVVSQFAEYRGRVFLAYGGNYPDALSGGVAAAAEGAPLLLSASTFLPAASRAALARMTPTGFVLLGSAGVLGPTLVQELTARYPDARIERWAGADRYATSAAIAKATHAGDSDSVFLATGLNFPDALAGVVAAAKAEAPLLLARTTCLPPPVFVEVDDLAPDEVVMLGGPSVLADRAPSLVCGPPPQPAESVDCDDFPTRSAAQAWFNYYYPWFGDIAKLDRDNDGIACEGDP